MLTQILRAKPRSHCRAPLQLPLPPSHCNATTADRTVTSRCLCLTRHVLSQATAELLQKIWEVQFETMKEDDDKIVARCEIQGGSRL